MKKIITYGLLFTSLSLSLSQIANAEMVDAKSVALGGTTLGLANNAFAPLRNPAAMVDLGWGSFILPLSPVGIFGNNVGSFSSAIDTFQGKSTTGNSFFDNFSNNSSSRIEAQAFFPALGYSGTPFKHLVVMGKPVALGINAWGRGYATANLTFSKGLSQFISSSPLLFKSIQGIQEQASTLNQQFSGITATSNIPDVSKFSTLNPNDQTQVNALADQVETFQKNTLQPLILQGDTVVTSFSKIGTDLKTTLDKFDDLAKNKQTGKGDVVADGHAVIAVSGASRIFKNEMFDVSVGVNLKGFFFPGNVNANSILGNNTTGSTGTSSSNPILAALLTGGQTGNVNLLPITVKTDLNLGPFKSIDDMKSVIDNKLFPLITNAQDLLTTAKKLDSQLSTSIPKARQSGFSVIPDVPALQEDVTGLQSQAALLNQKLSGNASTQLSGDILNSLASDLKDVKINYNQMTDVSSFGFGLDLGFQAKVAEDINLGLVFENPLVLWPAKMRNNTIAFNTTQLQAGGTTGQKIDLNNILQVMQDPNPTSSNYNLSEPFAVRFGGSYNLGKLSSYLGHSTILADVEQVFNDRPFALHLGFEKGFYFGPGAVFVRIGTQLGGLGNMVTFGLGAKGGPFNISLGYGASNPFNPVGSNNAVAGLSTSLDF